MTDAADTRKAPSPRWRVVASVAVVGIFAVSLGFSRFMAGFYLGPHDQTLSDLAKGVPVSAPLLKRMAESRESAFAWVPSGDVLADLATLRLASIATARILSPERRRLVADAVALQSDALALAPADAYGWTRLLQGLALSAAPASRVDPVLRMSLAQAPFEPGLVRARVGVGLLYWRGLGAPARAALGEQMIVAAYWMPGDLLAVARARGLEDEVAARIAADPVALARFNYTRARPTTR